MRATEISSDEVCNPGCCMLNAEWVASVQYACAKSISQMHAMVQHTVTGHCFFRIIEETCRFLGRAEQLQCWGNVGGSHWAACLGAVALAFVVAPPTTVARPLHCQRAPRSAALPWSPCPQGQAAPHQLQCRMKAPVATYVSIESNPLDLCDSFKRVQTCQSRI